MLAVQLTAWGAEPELREIPTPRPSGAELLVRVEAAGLCRSDLHIMDSAAGAFGYPLPLTLGHEVAGTVLEAGSAADRRWIGETVVVHGIWSCGGCRNCARGRENYCLRLRPGPDGRGKAIGNGLGHPGGLAEAMIVPSARFLVPARGVDPVLCAPLADAGLTAYHAVRQHRDLIDAGSVCLVVGVGGLGHLAVQILREFGAGRIIAIDNRPDALGVARRLGVDATFPDIPSATTGLGDGADLILDFAGAPDTVGAAGPVLAPGGRLVVVGSAGGRLEVGKDVGLAAGWTVTAPFWGPRSDLATVVDLARRGALHVTAETFPLTEAVEVYRRLRSGGITGRAVLVPPA
ncbi:NAD(P)-dependent alcohol dehydrogenase [Nocardia rhamnosiphila]